MRDGGRKRSGSRWARGFSIGVHIGLAAAIAAFVWPLADMGLVAAYAFWGKGSGGIAVSYTAVAIVGAAGMLMGALSLPGRVSGRLSKGVRRSGRWNLILGAACLALVWQVAPRRWGARERGPANGVPIVYSSGYNISVFGLEKWSTFRVDRYARIFKGLCAAGIVDRGSIVVPRAVTDDELALVHTEEWIAETRDPLVVADVFEVAVIGTLPTQFVQERIAGPFRLQARGTVLAAQLALERGAACTLGGGFAHAQRDSGEGFNLYADAPLAIATLRRDGFDGRIMLVDADVHHGQGNARYYKDDASVFIVDIYNAENYPYVFDEVDCAIELASGDGDQEYLSALRAELPGALDAFAPKLVIYIAGVDCSEHDALGGLAVTEEGLFARDKFVIDEVTGRGIALCVTLAGGYWEGSEGPSVRMVRYLAGER